MDNDPMQEGYEAPTIEANHEETFDGFKIRVWVRPHKDVFVASAAIDSISGTRISLAISGDIAVNPVAAIALAVDAAKEEISKRPR